MGKKKAEPTTQLNSKAPIADLSEKLYAIAQAQSSQRLTTIMEAAKPMLASHQVGLAITRAVRELEEDGEISAARWLQRVWRQVRL